MSARVSDNLLIDVVSRVTVVFWGGAGARGYSQDGYR